jgi:hypothetical protein
MSMNSAFRVGAVVKDWARGRVGIVVATGPSWVDIRRLGDGGQWTALAADVCLASPMDEMCAKIAETGMDHAGGANASTITLPGDEARGGSHARCRPASADRR